MKKFKAFLILIFVIIVHVLFAQNNVESDLDALKKAYLNFKNKNYKEAFPYYGKMINIYPKDPVYNYYTGICLLNLDHNPQKALKYLRYASVKKVPNDIWFYLGLAYLKNYEFNKALENFQKFKNYSGKKIQKKIEIDNYIAMAQNGIYLTKYIKKPVVYKKEKTSEKDFYKKYSKESLKGEFIKKDLLINQKEDSIEKDAIIYYSNAQNVVYYSDVNKERGDYDIFRISLLSDSVWSKPENLGDVINTPFDECFPYVHSDGLSLYFSSKGHYSMGGYDLYNSTWSQKNQQWTEPENMDFPLNSPYDDFLFVPSPDKRYAYFSSDRECDADNCFVYKIKLNNAEPYIELEEHDDILKYAGLNVNIDENKDVTEGSADAFSVNPLSIVKIEADKDFMHKQQYDSLINVALTYQLKADSLRWLIGDKRNLFEKTQEGQERAVLTNAIIELERDEYLYQKKADNCYEKVREIEQVNLAVKKNSYVKEPVAQNKNIQEKTPIKRKERFYSEPVSDSLKVAKLFKKPKEEIDESKVYHGLQIILPSVYNTNNPLPVNEKLPESITYKIQLGAFSSEKEPSIFKGLTPLSSLKSPNSKIIKYYAGRFSTLEKAENGLLVVKSKGFKDAYVVAYKGNDIIPVKEAVNLESEKNNITELIDNQKEEGRIQEDLSIIYVLKSKKIVKDTAVVSRVFKQLPGSIELFTDKSNEGELLLIKPFKTFKKASEIKSVLEQNGNVFFEIHAYFAENHIPLQQAIKITK